jgi:hypothetical protein
MRSQHFALPHRIIAYWLHIRSYPTQSYMRYPNTSHRFDNWIAGTVFVMFMLGVILAAHC